MRIDYDAATKEFVTLLQNLEDTGLHVEVRPGYEQSILLFVKAPSELLGNRVYKLRYEHLFTYIETLNLSIKHKEGVANAMSCRVRDWLYGITQTRPPGNKDTVVSAWYEAEDILSMSHLVSWPKSMGGAGITPNHGQWKNVKSTFPMHNEKVNQAFLRHLGKKLLLGTDDLDKIRDLFGSKVCNSIPGAYHIVNTHQ